MKIINIFLVKFSIFTAEKNLRLMKDTMQILDTKLSIFLYYLLKSEPCYVECMHKLILRSNWNVRSDVQRVPLIKLLRGLR